MQLQLLFEAFLIMLQPVNNNLHHFAGICSMINLLFNCYYFQILSILRVNIYWILQI
jgi:hypothetical protein